MTLKEELDKYLNGREYSELTEEEEEEYQQIREDYRDMRDYDLYYDVD